MKVSSFLTGGVCALVFGAATLAAQQKSPIGKGSWLVGGSAGLSHTDEADVTTASLAPFGLYFVAPHLALGGTLDLAYASSHVQVGDSHTTLIGVEPTIRYFFGDLSGNLFPYLNASVGPSWEKFKIDGTGSSADGEQTTTGLELTGSAGLMRMLATHVGLTGELYYTHAHQSTDVSTTTSNITHNQNSYGLRFGISAFVF